MALIGDVTLYKQVPDEENSFETEIITPDGEKKTITEAPTKEVVSELIEDAYVVISISSLQILDYDRYFPNDDYTSEIEVETPRGETKDDYRVFYQYRIYESKEARQDRFNTPLHELNNDVQIVVSDLNLGGKNIIHWCYDHLKTKKGFENLIKD